MIQYTTPTITVTITGVALDASDDVWLTLQPQSKGNLTGEALTVESPAIRVEGTDTIVSAKLTQEQTAALSVPGEVFLAETLPFLCQVLGLREVS